MTRKNLGDSLATDDEVSALRSRKRKIPPKRVTPPTATAAPDTSKFVRVSDMKRTWIVLEENDNIPPTGQFLAVNGDTFMLRPGEAAFVPEAVINVLNDAVEATPQVDPTTRQVVGFRRKLRFPYRLAQASEIPQQAA